MAIKAAVTPAEAVEYLNSLIACDQHAITSLLEYRVPVRKALADHPTCQAVLVAPDEALVGLLGVLNGLFGVDDTGYGAISAVFDEDYRVVEFRLRAAPAVQKQPTKEEP